MVENAGPNRAGDNFQNRENYESGGSFVYESQNRGLVPIALLHAKEPTLLEINM